MYELHSTDFFEDPEFPLTLAPRDPQPLFPIHRHDFCELVLVLGGTGVHFTRDDQYQVIAGDVYLINGELAHGYKNLDDLVLINIIFKPEGLGLPSEDLSRIPGYHALFTIEPRYRTRDRFQSRLRLAPREMARASALVEAMEAELTGRPRGYRFLAKSLFFQLIGFLSRCYSGESSEISGQRYRLGKVISFMEHHTDRSIRIDELIEISGGSESTLLRDFKRITDSTPLEYHLKLRIRRACRLLRLTDDPVTRIAFETGFEDSNYFSRQFRKVMGLSPRDYRKN